MELWVKMYILSAPSNSKGEVALMYISTNLTPHKKKLFRKWELLTYKEKNKKMNFFKVPFWQWSTQRFDVSFEFECSLNLESRIVLNKRAFKYDVRCFLGILIYLPT